MASVLFVCLGNICRSPVAEGLARVFNEHEDIFDLIDSAGTSGYHIGEPPHSTMRRIAKDRGVFIDSQKSRQVSLKDFENFEYIVAMDTSNYEDLKSLQPNDSKAKVVRLLDFSPSDLLDVPDPYYGGPQGFEICFEIVEEGMNGFFKAVKVGDV